MGNSRPGRIIAIVLSLAIVGVVTWLSWVFFADAARDPQSTYAPASDNTNEIQGVYEIVFWLAGIVFFGVLAATLAFALMFRERPGQEAKQIHGNSRLEVLWTLLPVVIVVAIAVPTFDAVAKITGAAPADALQVRAIGHQWWFEFQYPELGITTANELHVPVDRPVEVTLESIDVIHSFWVPQLAGKIDMVPGHTNRLWFTPNEARADAYLGQCAEFCGTSHANMRFRVFVDTQADFDAWAAAEGAPASAPTAELALQGMQQFTNSGCVGCHTVSGNDLAQGKVGPNLTHVGSRTTIAAGMMDNTTENLTRWLSDPPGVKPGSKMPNLNLTPEQVKVLIAYLQGLQ